MDNFDSRLFDRRVGYLIDGVAETPMIPATLTARDERRFLLEMQYEGRAAWTREWFHDWQMPTTLGFVDDLGKCTLVGCSLTRTNGGAFPGGVSKATARVGALLNGVIELGEDVDRAHEMRSSIAGLHAFMGWRVSSTEFDRDEEGLIRSKAVRFAIPEPVEIALGDASLAVTGHWRPAPEASGTTETTVVHTSFPRAVPWEEHAARHGAVRDLVSLSFWQGCEYLTHEVRRPDWPLRSINSEPMGPHWWRVVTDDFRKSSAPPQEIKPSVAHSVYLRHLGGDAGLARWFDVAERYSRTVGPLVSVLYEAGSVEARLMQVGIAMEAFAYQGCIEEGMPPKKADDMRTRRRAEWVLEHVKSDTGWDLDATFDWPTMFADSYNAVKHAARPLPGIDETFAAYFSGAQLLRRGLLQMVGAETERLDQLWRGYAWDSIWPR